jgi:hypothetical protein
MSAEKLSLFLATVVYVAGGSHAMAWDKVAECNQGAVVIDTECWSYRGVPCYTRAWQMVIRDKGVVEHFRKNHADGRYVYNSGNPYWSFSGEELIIPLEKSNSNNTFSGEKAIALDIPYADSAFQAKYFVKQDGHGLSVEAFKDSSERNDIVPQGKLADWYFENCQF